MKIDSTMLAGLFGEMIKVAPAIESYHGDLFHDAVLLKTAEGDYAETFSAVWAVGQCGTHLAMGAVSREGCAWHGVDSYDRYTHYRVVYNGGTRTLSLERMP